MWCAVSQNAFWGIQGSFLLHFSPIRLPLLADLFSCLSSSGPFIDLSRWFDFQAEMRQKADHYNETPTANSREASFWQGIPEREDLSLPHCIIEHYLSKIDGKEMWLIGFKDLLFRNKHNFSERPFPFTQDKQKWSSMKLKFTVKWQCFTPRSS